MMSSKDGQLAMPNKSLGYASKYRKIILRIGLYPLVSCILNYSTVALDLYQTVDGVYTNIVSILSFF